MASRKTGAAKRRRREPELYEVALRAWNGWVGRPPGRLQSVFDERVSTALARLGVPSREELAELRAKVEQLLALQIPVERASPRRSRPAPRKGATTSKAARARARTVR